MTRILILYATREGQTEKVATQIATHLKNVGATVQLVNAQDRAATEAIDLDVFDQLVFGASIKLFVRSRVSAHQVHRWRPRRIRWG